tara:strand:+ start:100 stop:552 length:453 start_codon:yes stop_codon:yes gene_type:complete
VNKKNNFFNFKRPFVFVPMCADFIHHGHINILKKSKKLGNTIVGLMTDAGIASYKKRKPIINYKNRKKILESIKFVDFIIPCKGIEYVKLAKKYKFDYFVHGSDWKKGVQSSERNILKKVVKKWNGKVIDIPYTKGISSTNLKNKLRKGR